MRVNKLKFNPDKIDVLWAHNLPLELVQYLYWMELKQLNLPS